MGDLFKVTAPSGLKLRATPSTDAPVLIFAMLQGTIVEAMGASEDREPHFTPVRVNLDQAVILREGESASMPSNDGYAFEEGWASADWLVPLGDPMPEPGPDTIVPAVQTSPPAQASAATGTGGVMLLLVAVVAAALYAAK